MISNGYLFNIFESKELLVTEEESRKLEGCEEETPFNDEEPERFSIGNFWYIFVQSDFWFSLFFFGGTFITIEPMETQDKKKEHMREAAR